MATKKTKTYGWAVVNGSGKIMRESNDRRAIYRTREQARMSARVLKGRAVRRDKVVTTPKAIPAEQSTLLAVMATI